MKDRMAKLRGRYASDSVMNLDDAALGKWTLIITYNGVKTAVERDRLLDLLRLEEDLLASMASGGAAPADAGHGVGSRGMALKNRQVPDGPVTHASLSNRVTKIHKYSRGARELRPAHAGLLGEVLQNFDWVIPDHPNLRLAEQLGEIVSWDAVSGDLKGAIKGFLERYLALRDKS